MKRFALSAQIYIYNMFHLKKRRVATTQQVGNLILVKTNPTKMAYIKCEG